MIVCIVLLLEALVAPTALESINLVLVKEGICISSSVALKERYLAADALLYGTRTGSISIVDRRAIEA